MSVNDWLNLLYWTVSVYVALFVCTLISGRMMLLDEDRGVESGWSTLLTGSVAYILWWICSKFLSLLIITVVAVLAVGATNYD